jgi:hypothetical protein
LLAVFPYPDAFVCAFQTRGDSARSNRLLAAVLRCGASDDFALRTALQALVPGLSATSRRYGWRAGGVGPWASRHELDQDVVAFGYEELHVIATSPVAWPATRVLDRVGRRLRTLVGSHDREAARRATLHDACTVESEVSPVDELSRELRDAVRAGTLGQTAAAVVFSTDVLGRSPAEVAAEFGKSRWFVYKARERATQRLCAL